LDFITWRLENRYSAHAKHGQGRVVSHSGLRSVSNTRANEGVVIVAPVVNRKPGDIAGFIRVGQGTTKNVKVPLQVQLTSGTYINFRSTQGTRPRPTHSSLSLRPT
jgi:hypothetical protein